MGSRVLQRTLEVQVLKVNNPRAASGTLIIPVQPL